MLPTRSATPFCIRIRYTTSLPDAYETICSKIAPSIFGHNDVKRAVSCFLFGGSRKSLPDGVKLRGEINVLLLGDLSTAKSQLGLLKNLQYLELYSSNISGTIPSDLGNLTSLVSWDLYLNGFTSSIPESLGKLSKLRFLRLNNNSLTGPIPMSLTNITSLQVLDLSNNRLSGAVPDNGSFLPFTPISFANNLNLCGPVTGQPCPGSPPSSPPPLVPPPPLSTPGAGSTTGAIAGGVAAGAALLFAAPAIAFAYWRRRKPQEYFFDVPAEEDPEVHLGQLKMFSLRELQVATDTFSNKTILVAVKRTFSRWFTGGCQKT